MKLILALTTLYAIINITSAYSKYGRTCKDIGCGRNEECVMQEDPCSYYQRDNECGKYPTCKRVSSKNDCTSYICPPSMVCKVEGGNPKCVDDPAASSSNGKQYSVNEHRDQSHSSGNPSAPNYPSPSNNNYQPPVNPNYPANSNYPSNPNYPSNSHYPQNPNYPYNPSGGIYPQIPSGQTTPRPYRPAYPNSGGGGYQGGAVGSGYPGQSGNYPQNSYPGHNTNGYPNTNNQGGYRNPYQNPYGNNYRGTSGSSNPFVDSLTDSIKTIGTKILTDAIAGKLGNNGQPSHTNQGGGYNQPGGGYPYRQGQNAGNYYPSQPGGSTSTSGSDIVDKLKSVGGSILKDLLNNKN